MNMTAIDQSTGVSIAVIAIALTLFGGGFGFLWLRVSGALNDERRARERLAIDDQNGRLIILRELQDYKLYVAQNYVSGSALRETEERLIASNEKLSDYLDKIVNRLDKLAVDMARAGITTTGK